MHTPDDITERNRVQETLRLNELRVQALLELNEMADQPMQMIIDFALERAIELTRSKTGYLAFLNADETLLTMNWWPKAATGKCAAEAAAPLYPVVETVRWQEAVCRRGPVIANEEAPAGSFETGSAGDPGSWRHVDVPVFDGESIVAVAGVGSKETSYDENDVRQLMLLTTGTWRLVQRKQGEDRLRATAEALRRSEAYLAQAQRLTHTGSWVDDGTMRPVYWSDEHYRIFGFDPQQALPTREGALERIHADDRDKVRQAFERTVSHRVDSEAEYRLVHPDGTIRYAHSIGHPVLDGNGNLVEIVGTTVDVTERRRNAEALALTSFALNNAHDAAALLDEYGRILYVNDEACRQSGYTRDELLAMHVWDVNPDFSPERWSDHWQALRTRQSVTFESCHRRKVGGAFPVEISARYVEYEGAAFNVAIVRDITERKRAEEALRRSESYLAEAQRLTHTGSWATDPTTGPLYWSEELYRIFGLDPQEGIPTRSRALERIHPEDRDKFIEAFNRGIREKIDVEVDYRIVLPDGTIKFVHGIGRPVHSANGELVEIVGTTIEITERKRAEDALRRSEAYLSEAQRLTHTGSWADNGTPVYWSEEHYRIFGLDPQQGLPSREQVLERIHPDDRAMVVRAFDTVKLGKVDGEAHYRIVMPDGTVKYAHGIGHPSLDANGDFVEIVGTTVDVTERRRAEQERARLHQLEADLAHLNRVSVMGELTASIAHEVNQPLSGVVSNGSACLRWLAGDTPNLVEAREAARRIVRDGKRAAEIIARIRALTKRTTEHRERLDLNETMREILLLVGDEAKKKNVNIGTCFAEGLFPVVGDRVQLQQVILNLVMNGIEAMNSVTDRPRELVITSRNADEGQVEVTIQDSGIGLDPNQSARIFDAFYTTKPSGMGMGLSISRSILQAHGGRLWATANDGPGTTFHFTLPKQEEEDHAEQARA